MDPERFNLVISRLEEDELASLLRLIFPAPQQPDIATMELRKPKMRITTAEWIDRQRRDLARFVMGRPYIVMLDETTKEQVYHPVELIDSALHTPPERSV